MLLQFIVDGFTNGCLYALVAVGFALIYNTTRMFHLAHGATYTAAAYFCYILVVRLHWNTLSAIIVAVLLTAAIGVMMLNLIYAPLERRGASQFVLLLSSLGLYVILINLIALLFGNSTQTLSASLQGTVQWGPVVLTRIQLGQGVSAIVLLPIIFAVLKHTSLGRCIRATRDNSALTAVLGVNPVSVSVTVFAVGSALAGLAAVLTALDVGIDPNAGLPVLLTATVAMIVGGVRTFEGAALGGLLLGVLQGIILWKISARWMDALTYTIFVLFLLLRPQGLLGRRRRLEEGVA